MLTNGHGRLQLAADDLVSRPVLMPDVPSAATKELAPRLVPFPLSTRSVRVAAHFPAIRVRDRHLGIQNADNLCGRRFMRYALARISHYTRRIADRMPANVARASCPCDAENTGKMPVPPITREKYGLVRPAGDLYERMRHLTDCRIVLVDFPLRKPRSTHLARQPNSAVIGSPLTISRGWLRWL
jgi:hypothetical protein